MFLSGFLRQISPAMLADDGGELNFLCAERTYAHWRRGWRFWLNLRHETDHQEADGSKQHTADEPQTTAAPL